MLSSGLSYCKPIHSEPTLLQFTTMLSEGHYKLPNIWFNMNIILPFTMTSHQLQQISTYNFNLFSLIIQKKLKLWINNWYVAPKQQHCLSTQNLLLVCLKWSSFNSGMYRGYKMTYWEISRTSLQESNFPPGVQRKYKKSENVCTQEYWNLNFINSFF